MSTHPPRHPDEYSDSPDDWSRYQQLVLGELARNAKTIERMADSIAALKEGLNELAVQRQMIGDLKTHVEAIVLSSRAEMQELRSGELRTLQSEVQKTQHEIIIIKERMRFATALISMGVSMLVLVAEKLVSNLLSK